MLWTELCTIILVYDVVTIYGWFSVNKILDWWCQGVIVSLCWRPCLEYAKNHILTFFL